MKKLDVMMDIPGDHWYKAAAIDLSQVALAIYASGSGTCWKLTLNCGRELKVKPTDRDYSYDFTKLVNQIQRAKIYARTLIKQDDAQEEIEEMDN